MSVKKHLKDITMSGEKILIYIKDMDYDAFVENRVVYEAVIYNFIIIAEASKRIITTNPELSDELPEVKRIIGFRNYIVHAYDSVDEPIVWAAAQNSLPIYLNKVRELLQKCI